MSIEFETLDVWIGEFPSCERLNMYFHEILVPDDDDAPISEFAEDMCEPYYDHDFVECKFHEPRQTVDRLLRDHSYSNSYHAAVTKVANDLGVIHGNTTVLVWGCQILKPVSVVEDDYTLKYIGRFDCNPSHG
jgi:Immunity protein 22